MEGFIVGVDGSKASEAALRWASRIAACSGAELLAIHSFVNPYSEMSPDDHARLMAERSEELAGEWTRPAVEAGATVRTEVLDGDPRTSLMAHIESDPPDLLVLGRSGRGGGPGFMHLGSMVEQAVHYVGCPLAVIPADGGGPVRRIVLGVDGSDPAAAAVDWCARFASSTGAEVLAVTVHEPLVEWTPSWDEKNWRRDVERDAANWVRPLVDAGVTVETLATENLHPADGLLGVASARDADLLVLGTRGAGGFAGLRFGGVAIKVLHRASLPLVLVPPTKS